jgi:hypothetical protein
MGGKGMGGSRGSTAASPLAREGHHPLAPIGDIHDWAPSGIGENYVSTREAAVSRFRRHKGINFILSLDLFAPNISAKMSDTNKISIDSQTFCHLLITSALIS